jgi:hypothetical protein
LLSPLFVLDVFNPAPERALGPIFFFRAQRMTARQVRVSSSIGPRSQDLFLCAGRAVRRFPRTLFLDRFFSAVLHGFLTGSAQDPLFCSFSAPWNSCCRQWLPLRIFSSPLESITVESLPSCRSVVTSFCCIHQRFKLASFYILLLSSCPAAIVLFQFLVLGF